MGWLGDHPKRSLLRIGAALLGIAVAGSALAVIWPKPDPVGAEVPSAKNPSSLAPLPDAQVMVLVVGLDADSLNASFNQAAPLGAANADSLMLVGSMMSTPPSVRFLMNLSTRSSMAARPISL